MQTEMLCFEDVYDMPTLHMFHAEELNASTVCSSLTCHRSHYLSTFEHGHVNNRRLIECS